MKQRLSSAERCFTVFLLLLNKWDMALSKQLPCLILSERNYVFPADHATFGLHVAPETPAELVRSLATLSLLRNAPADRSLRNRAGAEHAAQAPGRADPERRCKRGELQPCLDAFANMTCCTGARRSRGVSRYHGG